MSTLYDIFKVKEDATNEEIENAYRLIEENFKKFPTDEENLNKFGKIKIAYEILIDKEKRKKYDDDLALKRASELLENIKPKKNTEKEFLTNEENKIKMENDEEYDKFDSDKYFSKNAKIHDVYKRVKAKREKENKQKIEKKAMQDAVKNIDYKQMKKDYIKNAKKEMKKARKKEQLEQEKKMYQYGEYLQRQGYKVKYPWTWRRVKRLLISIAVVIILCIILWNIPFVKNKLINLYNNNFVIKGIVDIFKWIFESISEIIKNNRK